MQKKDDQASIDLGALLKPHFISSPLTKDEMDLGERLGKDMWQRNKAAGRVDERSSEEATIAWVRSEIRVARWLGKPYEHPDGKFTTIPDVYFVDVRWTEKMDDGLTFRRKDPDNRPIVSTAGIAPNIVLRGWELSHHIRNWGKMIASKQKSEDVFDQHDKFYFPWCQLKPMYLLSRDPNDYKVCYGCDGTGISTKTEPCKYCALGKVLGDNPEAFKQLLKAVSFPKVA